MNHSRMPAVALAAVGVVLGAAMAAPANAGQQSTALQLAQAQSYSDEKLRSFAMAALDVQQIRQEYTAKFAEADSEEERRKLAQDASEEMVDAVESTPGITVEEYNEIIETAADDPALQKRITQHIESSKP